VAIAMANLYRKKTKSTAPVQPVTETAVITFLTKFYNMKTYAVVKNPYGGVKVWHKNGRAKWYTNINHEDLEPYIAKLVAQGYTKFQP
jgi:hypothetical protein